MKRSSVLPSLCPVCPPSVCPSHRSTAQRHAAGLLLSARQAGDVDRLLYGAAGAGAQQQRCRSTALCSKCGQCRVDSTRRKLNTDLLISVPAYGFYRWLNMFFIGLICLCLFVHLSACLSVRLTGCHRLAVWRFVSTSAAIQCHRISLLESRTMLAFRSTVVWLCHWLVERSKHRWMSVNTL